MGLFSNKKMPETSPVPAPARPSFPAGGRGAFAPIGDLLRLAVESEASDIHLSVGSPPTA